LLLQNVGFAIATVAVLDQKTITWVLISCYLAGTAMFFAAMLGDNTQYRLDLLVRGTMAAAVAAALAAIIGYTGIVPELSELFLRFGRARGTFIDPNVLGAFLVFPMLIALQRLLVAGRAGE